MTRLGLVGLALFVSLSAVGCGSESGDYAMVTGKVTVDGEPIPMGSITFIAADGATPTGGGVIDNGTYIARVPPGEKIVLVVGNKLVGQEKLYEDMPDSPTRDKYEMITPEAYNAAHLTPLKASVTDSEQELDFQLSKGFKAAR